MIRGVLFDMDGVVFDTEKEACRALTAAAQARGYAYAEDTFLKVLGTNEQVTKQIYRGIYGDDFPTDMMHQVEMDSLAALAKSGSLRYKKGFEICIAGLRARGIKVALATSTSRELVEVYREYYPVFRHAFDALVCGMEVPNGKPKPDIYLLAAKKLGLSPKDCLGVEDSCFGLMSLRAAGCIPVMVPDMLPYAESVAPYVDHLLDDLTQLCPLIDQFSSASENLTM